MKNLVLLLALVCAGFCAEAQVVDGVDIWEKKEVDYLEIVGNINPLTRKTIVAVDYGQKVDMSTDTRVEGPDGKVVKFNSTIDAVNQFSAWGWDVFQVYVSPEQQVKYVMRRRLN